MKRIVARALAGIGAWIVVQTPTIAQACAVCTAGKDEENALAFLKTTIFLSVMPLVAIGTLVFVLWRRIRKLEEERAGADVAILPEAPPFAPPSAGSET